MNPTETDTQTAWQQLAPLLDEAIAQLGEADRAAVVLRYFEQRPLGEVGAALGVGEDAAQKRVTRALDKLHKRLASRGVTLSVALIAGAVSGHAVQAAPVNLAAKILAMGGKGVITTSLTTMVKGTMKTMMWSQLKMPAIGIATVIIAAGTMAWFAPHPNKPVAEIPYRMMEDGWLFQQSINPTNLTFHFLIGSSNPHINAKNIHLTIHSASKGDIPVRLGGRGQVLNFPCDDDLRQENPPVISDQPKGTLGLGYWVYVPTPAGVSFPYERLASAVQEANEAASRAKALAKSNYNQAAPMFSGTVNSVGLVFGSGSAGKAKVTIESSEGTKEYIANSQGIVELKINARFQAENPIVKVSERPSWIGVGHL